MVNAPTKESFISRMSQRLGSYEENRLIVFLIVVTLILGVLGIFTVPIISSYDRSGDFIEYSAILYRNGTLDERYIYHLTGNIDTRMLYRFWDMDLSINDLSRPHIKFIEINLLLNNCIFTFSRKGCSFFPIFIFKL